MKLADLRKLAIRKKLKIRFALRNGMECVICEDGVARVPALKAQPDFNLEQELASSPEFLLEPVVPAGDKNPPKPRSVGRDELEKLVVPAPAAGRDDHEEE